MKYSHLIEGISETLMELGTMTNVLPIQNSIKKLDKTNSLIDVDFYLSNAIAANKLHPFWEAFAAYEDKIEFTYLDFLFHPIKFEVNRIKKLGTNIPAFAILIVDENLNDKNDSQWNYLLNNLKQYALLLVINYAKNDEIINHLKNSFRGKIISKEVNQLAPESLKDIVLEAINTELKDSIANKTAVNTILPLIELTKEVVQHEQHLALVRKNINAQMGTIIRKDEVLTNMNDVSSSIKTQIQYWNTDTEKTIKLKYDDLNKPNTGLYSNNISDWINKIVDLEKSENADKSEKWNSHLKQDYLIDVENRVKAQLTNDFTNDYNLIVSSIEETLQKINLTLSQKGIITSNDQFINLDYSRFPDPSKTLSNYTSFTKYYNGELIKQGAMEYFIALREYTGLIMVVAGLLAPLNMISGISENEFLKSLSKGIRIITGLVTIFMIFYGYFELRKRIPKKRKEDFDKELRRAKDIVQGEVKRMFSDSSKDWQSSLSQWLREVTNQLQFQLEKQFREFNEKQQQKINQEKVKLQKMNQSFDTNSKRISNAERMIDNLMRAHKDAVTEIERNFR
jgi:hypothetical protein